MAGNAHGSSAPGASICCRLPAKMCAASRWRGAAAQLELLLAGAEADLLRFSEAFDDAEKLLAAALELGLEGIVSMKRDQPYRLGKNLAWIKVKTAAWREANRDRWEMFEGR